MKRSSSRAICALILMWLTLLPNSARASSFGQEVSIPRALSEGTFVVRVYYERAYEIGRLAEFDVFEYNNVKEQYVLAAVDAQGYDRLQALGFRVQIDPQETANFTRPSPFLPDQADSIPSPYTCYRTVEETYATAAAIVTAHPGLAAWIDAGDSWEKTAVTSPDTPGYDMMVLRLTNSAIPGPKPKLFITSSIHAREYAPAELVTRFAEHLVNNYGIDADVTWLLDWHEIHLMLQANPDGRKQAETDASWRKNTNQNYCGATSTSLGADLNRNFAFHWGCCGGSSSDPCNLTYRGPSAASEPETQAIQTYMASIFPDQRDNALGAAAAPGATGVYIDVHSYSKLVLWPWGFTSTVAPNGAALQTLGRKIAFFNNYTPQQSISLYATDGTTHDFAYGDLGVAAFTFEIGTAFFQSCTSFERTVIPDNMPALLYAAKVVRTPYQTPAGPEALNVTASPVNVPQGSPAALAASLDDTRYSTINGTEPAQNIAAAEYYVDVPPWDTAHGPVAHPMAAADGSFNSTVENVTAAVATGSLTVGRHIIFVRGQDAAGNWGPFSAAFLDVTPCVAPAAPAGLTITRGSGLLDEVQLAWTAPEGAARYQVWRALNEPYFTPGDDCSSPGAYACTETIATSYPDNVTADNPTYVVRALSTCGGYSDAAYQHVGRFRFSLIPGQ